MNAPVAQGSLQASVVTRLYLRTRSLHVEAERSGIIRDLLRGHASRDGYILMMRNLVPAYRQLEKGLDAHASSPALKTLAAFQLNRAAAIESDLDVLCGPDWSERIALLEAGEAYARAVEQATNNDGTRLIAHAYVRYLGDLSGGLILKKLLARAPGLKPAEMSFYNFPAQFPDLAKLKSDYRNALDHAAALAADQDAIVEEGAAAFSLNIDLSCAVELALTPTPLVS